MVCTGNSNFEPIVFAFDVQAYGQDSSAVIDVGPFFLTDVAMLGLPAGTRTQYQVRRLDPARTFMDGIRSFPRNIETKVVLTYDAGAAPSNQSSGAISLLMNHSMLLLPEKPMMGRLADDRVRLTEIRRARVHGLALGRDVARVGRRVRARRAGRGEQGNEDSGQGNDRSTHGGGVLSKAGAPAGPSLSSTSRARARSEPRR